MLHYISNQPTYLPLFPYFLALSSLLPGCRMFKSMLEKWRPCLHSPLCKLLLSPQIPYSWKFSREKTFTDLAYPRKFSPRKSTATPIPTCSWRRQAIHKSFLLNFFLSTNSWKFSPLKVFRYTVITSKASLVIIVLNLVTMHIRHQCCSLKDVLTVAFYLLLHLQYGLLPFQGRPPKPDYFLSVLRWVMILYCVTTMSW